MEAPSLPNSPCPEAGRPAEIPAGSLRSKFEGFYHRHEKYAGIWIFSLGFIWDSLTLTSVDNLVDNIVLLFYLIATGILIVLTLRKQGGPLPGKWVKSAEPHFLWLMQFFFGGLLSSYVVFYFKSVSWTRTQVFFILLVLLWVGNELLQHRLQNPKLLATLYCFCLFSFLTFFLPVVLSRVDAGIFLEAGMISVAVSLIVFSIGLAPQAGEWRSRMLSATAWIFFTFFAVSALYFANLIPPVPLALKSAGIYHHVARIREGYQVKYVPPPLHRFWKKWDDPFYFSPGESVYCYSAVFAPRKIRVPVLHVWSRRTDHGWVETDRIGFEIYGGRGGGYRGYTAKKEVESGRWRVELQTLRGQTLGKVEFSVLPSPDPHPQMITGLIR